MPKHIPPLGSSFDKFLEDEGILEDVTAAAEHKVEDAKMKTMKLKTISGFYITRVLHERSGTDEYVPAAVAQGLLDALRLVQWGESGMCCPYCGGTDLHGHHLSCKVGIAIAAATEQG